MRNSRRTRLILALLLLTAFTLITLDLRGHSMSRLRSLASDVFGPIERAVTSVVHPIGSAFASLGHVGSYPSQVANLSRQNAQLRTQLRELQAEQTLLTHYERLLGLAGSGGYRIVGATVTALDTTLGYQWTATIDAGTRDGVRPGDTVINGDGLVGRIAIAASTTSTVLLAVNGQFTVVSRLAPAGTVGYVTGHGPNSMLLTLLSVTEHVHPGEGLVTAGVEPFVPGVPIGAVVTNMNTPGALTRTALIRPYVNFTALDTVGVVIARPRTDPRFSLLPTPPPAPTPSPGSSPGPSVSARPAGSASPGASPTSTPTP